MSFCTKCGASVPEGDNFCPNCGAPTGATPAYVDESDKTAGFSEEERTRNKYLGALCYLGPVFVIIALLAERDSKFIRYHANQAIMLWILAFACALVCIVPIIGWIAGGIGSIVAFVFDIMGLVRAFKGRAVDLPLVGKYTVLHYDD